MLPLTLRARRSQAAFHRDGHVHLRGVCSPEEVEAYGRIITGAAMGAFEDADLNPAAEGKTDTGRHFLQTLRLHERHPGVLQFVLAERFGRIVAELTRSAAVRIFHNQALFKEGGGSHTAWCASPPP